jgi:hypothetical protein
MSTPYRRMCEILARRLDLDSLRQAFCLSTLADRAVYHESFEPDADWATAVVPTVDGKCLLRVVRDSALSRLALFRLFYHHEPLVDPVASDLSRIRELLQNSILAGDIFLPHILGRELYDKFNSGFSG